MFIHVRNETVKYLITHVAGEEVVTQINEAYCDEKGRPYQDIRINHTLVLHDPFQDPEVFPTQIYS